MIANLQKDGQKPTLPKKPTLPTIVVGSNFLIDLVKLDAEHHSKDDNYLGTLAALSKLGFEVIIPESVLYDAGCGFPFAANLFKNGESQIAKKILRLLDDNPTIRVSSAAPSDQSTSGYKECCAKANVIKSRFENLMRDYNRNTEGRTSKQEKDHELELKRLREDIMNFHKKYPYKFSDSHCHDIIDKIVDENANQPVIFLSNTRNRDECEWRDHSNVELIGTNRFLTILNNEKTELGRSALEVLGIYASDHLIPIRDPLKKSLLSIPNASIADKLCKIRAAGEVDEEEIEKYSAQGQSRIEKWEKRMQASESLKRKAAGLQ